ncbi:MAG: four-helix bundle copper-binding protein [Ignavibacteria bacterium]
MHTQRMISSHPQVQGSTNDVLVRCVEACFDCEQACIACADACLGENMVQQLTQCIRLNLDCADVCRAAGALGSRRTGSNESALRTVLEACALACQTCADECGRHAQQHEHCAVCAEACRDCQQACGDAARSISPRH